MRTKAKKSIHIFEKVYIEISDYCALSCSFCPRSSYTQQKDIMDIALFKNICAQLEGRAKRVCLHILGDPLSVKDFKRYLEILRAHRLRVDLVTTGLFLRKNHFSLLLQKPLWQIAFSLSAFIANPTLLKDIHLRNILDFCHAHIALKSDANIESKDSITLHTRPFINLRFHCNDISEQNARFIYILKEILHFFGQCIKADSIKMMTDSSSLMSFKNHFSDFIITENTARVGQFDIKAIDMIEPIITALKAGMRVRLAPKILLVPTHSFEWRISPHNNVSFNKDKIQNLSLKARKIDMAKSKQYHKNLCYGAQKQFGILSDGKVVPCCMDYAAEASFGSLKEQSLSKIIESKSFLHFGEMLKNGQSPCELCDKCGYKLLF